MKDNLYWMQDDESETGFPEQERDDDSDDITGLYDRNILKEDPEDNDYETGFYGESGLYEEKLDDESETFFPDQSRKYSFSSKEEQSPFLICRTTAEKMYVIETPFYMGRSSYRVHFRIENPHVSNMHAAVIKEGGEYYLKDMNSLNGTYVQGERLNSDDRRLLYNGMEFELAGEIFTFFCEK